MAQFPVLPRCILGEVVERLAWYSPPNTQQLTKTWRRLRRRRRVSHEWKEVIEELLVEWVRSPMRGMCLTGEAARWWDALPPARAVPCAATEAVAMCDFLCAGGLFAEEANGWTTEERVRLMRHYLNLYIPHHPQRARLTNELESLRRDRARSLMYCMVTRLEHSMGLT